MKGYINIELGGVKRGIKFGNRALLDIMAKHQVNEGIKFSFDLVVDLVYFGLINNCMIKKENVDFALSDVEAWVDDVDMPLLLEIFQTFEASYSGDTKEITQSEAVKKKSEPDPEPKLKPQDLEEVFPVSEKS